MDRYSYSNVIFVALPGYDLSLETQRSRIRQVVMFPWTAMDARAAVKRLLQERPERLLVCEVCREDFHAPERLPRVLPCHHAYCDKCLEKMCRDSHLQCPECGRSVKR